jgi:hypothetical protein
MPQKSDFFPLFESKIRNFSARVAGGISEADGEIAHKWATCNDAKLSQSVYLRLW